MKQIKTVLKKMLAYGQDALSFIEGISEADFSASKINQYAVSLAILQIGELANALPDAYREIHCEIPWQSVRGMRNIIAHDYMRLDIGLMWKTLSTDLPELMQAVESLLHEEE